MEWNKSRTLEKRKRHESISNFNKQKRNSSFTIRSIGTHLTSHYSPLKLTTPLLLPPSVTIIPKRDSQKVMKYTFYLLARK